MNSHYKEKAIGFWLLACAATVYLMVVVGGITRLTQSGLSMVEWEPIMGIIPPLSLAEWDRVFQLYRSSPEYLLINRGMSLDEFKLIFWWEYGHRVLGRFIGLIYFVPFLFFLIRGWIPNGWHWKLFMLFILGGLQGLMGWYMVQSGLVDVPHVSQYRLTAHLGLAVVIFALLFWFALDFLRGKHAHMLMTRSYHLLACGAVALAFIMILSGGFVAGTKAGFIINTFPKMNGEWLPTGLMAMQPWWKNLFENAITIQFVHRALALVVAIWLAVLVWQSRRQTTRTYSYLVLVALLLQVSLGIAALLLKVPVWLGAAHQSGAIALFASVLFAAHVARKSAYQ